MLLAIVLGLATFLGGIAAALAFLPRVSVVPSDHVDPSNPFSASFTITNTNFITLKEVSAGLGIGIISTDPDHIDLKYDYNYDFNPDPPQIQRIEWQNHTLEMDERFTITIADIFTLDPSLRLSVADIAIVVSYKPWLLPFKRKKLFRFVAKKQTNGLFYWYSLPLKAKVKTNDPKKK